jgi:hypothetical protein
MSRLWEKSRSGSHAGRGFHYQDAVATEFAIRAWQNEPERPGGGMSWDDTWYPITNK